MISLGSLFSGVGGLELGIGAALGAEVVWQCERDAFPRSILARHWPDAVRFDDVLAMRHPPRVDVMCGGWPCQSHSVAGHRKGRDDARWLWPEFARIVDEVRPSIVVGENVTGHLSSDRGAAFADVLSSLNALGYLVSWRTIRASDVGAPHRRDRVFVCAWLPGVTSSRLGKPRTIEGHAGWPMPPGPTQHAYEPPRTIGRIPLRSKRLKALGNAVVPQQAHAVGMWLRDELDAGEPRGRIVGAFDGGRFALAQSMLFDDGEVGVVRWPRSGTVREGTVREGTVRSGTVRSGTVPTDAWASPTLCGNHNRAGASPTSGDGLATQVATWPTPAARDYRDAGHPAEFRRHSPGCSAIAAQWPTPIASENANRTTKPAPSHVAGTHGKILAAEVGGRLNPAWVECLMGFPIGWTESSR